MILYLVILAFVFLTSIIAFFVLNNNAREVRNLKVLGYVLLFSIIISVFGFLGKFPAISESLLWFIVFQFIFLLIGYLVFYLLKRNFWGVLRHEKVNKVLFVVINASAGMLGFTILFSLFCDSGLPQYYSMSVITFLMPQFVATAFNEYINIPESIYKIWYYPVGADGIDFENIDTSNIYMLELEYSKTVNDDRLTNTKSRAPIAMKFGDWFRAFIDNYNEKFETDPLIYLDADGTPYGWIFYVKPSFFIPSKYIDPDLTITQNRLGEKKVIIARRVRQI